MRGEGKSLKAISETLDISTATLSRRIAELEHGQGVLTKYRELQGLYLTKLECKVLTALEDGKPDQATPGELIKCLSVLLRAKKRIKGKGSKQGKSLLEHLKEEKFFTKHS
jgi:hypothetical protein